MKNTILLLSFIFSSVLLSAQPTYNASDYADPGDRYVVTRVFASQLLIHYGTISKDGPNQNWDFSFMQGGLQRKRNFYDPRGALDYVATYLAMCNANCLVACIGQCSNTGNACRSGCGGTFPVPCIVLCNSQETTCSTNCAPNCAIQCAGNTLDWTLAEKRRQDIDFTPLIDFKMEDSYQIMGKGLLGNGNRLTNYAFASRVRTSLVSNLPLAGLPIVVSYSDPDEKLKFPIVYGDSHSDHSEYGFDIGMLASLAGINRDFEFAFSQDRKTDVVGYGTIITPHGTYNNALKVRTELHREYEVGIEGVEVNTANWPDLFDPITEVEYLWFDAASGIPVFRVVGHVEFGLESYESAEYLDRRIQIAPIYKNDGNNGIGEEENEDFFTGSLATTIFPNPFQDELNIEIVSPVEGIADIQVYNSLGQLVTTETVDVASNQQSTHTIRLGRESNASGLYTIRVQIGDEYSSVNRAIRQ